MLINYSHHFFSLRLPLRNVPAEVVESDFWAELLKNYIPLDAPSNEPFSDFQHSILKDSDEGTEFVTTFDADYLNSGEITRTHNVVATLVVSIYWRMFLVDIVPESSQGLVVVFENPCSASFTYQIL